jgi:hypothetical protein
MLKYLVTVAGIDTKALKTVWFGRACLIGFHLLHPLILCLFPFLFLLESRFVQCLCFVLISMFGMSIGIDTYIWVLVCIVCMSMRYVSACVNVRMHNASVCVCICLYVEVYVCVWSVCMCVSVYVQCVYVSKCVCVCVWNVYLKVPFPLGEPLRVAHLPLSSFCIIIIIN